MRDWPDAIRLATSAMFNESDLHGHFCEERLVFGDIGSMNASTVELTIHSDVKTTLQFYSHSVSEDRMAAQGAMLQAILGSGADKSGLRADWSCFAESELKPL